MSKFRKQLLKGKKMDSTPEQSLSVTEVFSEQPSTYQELPAVPEQEEVTEIAVPQEVVQVQQTPKAAAEPVIKKADPALRGSPVVTKTAVENREQTFEQRIDALRLSGTKGQKSVIAKMDDYLSKMAPSIPIDPSIGGSQQGMFYMALRQLCEAPAEEFKGVFKLIIEYFRHHRTGALGERYVYRFVENINMSNEALKPYLALINLFLVAASAKSREQVIKQVDLNRLMNNGFASEQARQRIVQYFHS